MVPKRRFSFVPAVAINGQTPVFLKILYRGFGDSAIVSISIRNGGISNLTQILLNILHFRIILTRMEALLPHSRTIPADPRLTRVDIRSRKEAGVDATSTAVLGSDTVVLFTGAISSAERTPSGNLRTTWQSEEHAALTTRLLSHIYRFTIH